MISFEDIFQLLSQIEKRYSKEKLHSAVKWLGDFMHPSLDIEEIIIKISNDIDLSLNESREIVSFLMPIGINFAGYKNEYIEETKNEYLNKVSLNDTFNKEAKNLFKSILLKITSKNILTKFKIYLKGRTLQFNTPNYCLSISIVSDIRPILSDEEENFEYRSQMINHQLRFSIPQPNANSSPKDIYITVNDTILEDLKKQILRAEKKSKMFQKAFKF